MSEHQRNLKDIVRDLEQALTQIDSLDPENRTLLEEALSEMQSALAAKTAGYQPDQTLIQRLETAESEFQASHPTLSGIVMRLVDTLGQFGI